jgi:hypothetical protein
MIMTALMRISLNEPSIREKALAMFKRHSDSWDEDLQQRAVEYFRLLKLLEKDESAATFIEAVFEPLPTFPDHMQNNSVLIKRMSEMKSKKGLIIGKEDGKDDLNAIKKEEYKTSVSSALSKGKSIESTKTTSQSSDFLFGDSKGSQSKASKDDTGDLLDIDDFLSGSSAPKGSGSHPFMKQNPHDFSADQTVDLNVQADELEVEDDNDIKWKCLIPFTATDGPIYEDNDIKIN